MKRDRTERECLDAKGYEGLLTEGQTYALTPLAVGAVRFLGDDGKPHVCAAERFAR